MSDNFRSASITSNNPNGLLQCVKPMRLIASAVDPVSTDGESEWLWINTTNNNLFNKIGNGGQTWKFVYNFSIAPGTGLTDLSNVGGGNNIYTGIINPVGIANLRTLTSTGNTVTITQNPNTLNLEFNNSAGYINAISNLAIGNGEIANGIIGTTGNFKTITSTGNTITISQTPTTVNLETTNSGGGINSITNLIAGDGGLFASIVGSNANFKSINSPNASLLLSSTANTVDLQLNPTLVFKDAASFSCASAHSQLLSVPGTPVLQLIPFTFNGGAVSRGSWNAGLGFIQRTNASNAPAPYLYNVQCTLEWSSPTLGLNFSPIRFDLVPLTGNITFAGNYTSSATLTLCGTLTGSYIGCVSIHTICTISDNNPAQFGINAISTLSSNITVTNNSTQITIVQI
jgi:hypothetical protein